MVVLMLLCLVLVNISMFVVCSFVMVCFSIVNLVVLYDLKNVICGLIIVKLVKVCM